jgi:hypothetical protein
MTVGHLCQYCTSIPNEVREKLLFLKDQKSSGTFTHFCLPRFHISGTHRNTLIFSRHFAPQKNSLDVQQDGGGKRYWADGIRQLGVVETPKDGLAFDV